MKRIGLDVSHHQSPASVNWAWLVENDGFIIARATYGTRIDADFKAFAQLAEDFGIPLAPYHFYRTSKAMNDQLDAFQEAIDGVACQPGMLAPWVDLEPNQKFGDPWNAEGRRKGIKMGVALYREYGLAGMYMGAAYAKAVAKELSASLEGSFALKVLKWWIAHFPREPGKYGYWKREAAIHQFRVAVNHHLYRTHAPIDHNVMLVDIDDLTVRPKDAHISDARKVLAEAIALAQNAASILERLQ